jgi:DNA-binding Xre family transcriptional regulator
MTPEQVKQAIKDKRWNQKDVADLWGISLADLKRLIKNENNQRTVRDDCAFNGLPKKYRDTLG